MSDLPDHADTLIIGGGTTGAALAGLLVERSGGSVLVLEAGPDFGPYGDGGWPADVTDNLAERSRKLIASWDS